MSGPGAALRRRSRRRRASLPVLLIGGVSMAAGGIGLWTGSARAAISFTATGSAYGMRSFSTGAAFPLGAAPEAASPVAQAVVDSLGTSRGFASSPYPGDFFIGNYGLVAGLSGQQVPGYPLIVASDAATDPEPAGVDAPGYSLASKSDDHSTAASATQGPSGGGSQAGYSEAHAHAEKHGDGGVEVRTTSLSSGFSSAGVLSFGTVTTTATAEVDAAGHLVTHSDLQVTGATVNGQAVGFANGQFVAPGTAQPLPGNPFDAVLAQAGVKVTYVGEQRLPDGVESPGIEVSITQKAATGSPADGEYTTTYVLGRSIATVDHGGAADAEPDLTQASGAGAEPSDAAGTGGSAPGGDTGGAAGSLPAPTSGGAASASEVAAPSAAAPSSPSAPSTSARSTRPPAGRTTGRVALAADAQQGDAGTIYLVLVLAGVLLIASTGVVRYVGVRSPWTS